MRHSNYSLSEFLSNNNFFVLLYNPESVRLPKGSSKKWDADKQRSHYWSEAGGSLATKILE